MQYGRFRRGFKLANCKFRIHQLLMKKKAILGGAAFLLILFVLSFFPTYSPGDSDREAALFADRYADGYDLSGASLVDRYEQNDEMFSLYRRKGTCFLVWAKKSLYPGRYRIEVGSGPGGQGGKT
ncbi:hypothetical protein [Caproicibacter sp.]|uniref:hypothetical protein n=1 Tax=Caproicibacter sp. TaxID=2814884 RepID=UPI0039897970